MRVKPAQRQLLGLALLVALLGASIIVTYTVFTHPFPGFNDYMTPWEAARSFFYDGLDPYGPEASLNIQQRLYGRPAGPDDQPNHFAYPFYALFVAWPLIHMDYAWATAVWLVFNQALLVGALLLLLNLYGWQPRPLALAGLLLFTLLNYPAARGLLLGQVSHLAYFLQALALWALARRRDRLAGLALALSTFKPQMGVFLVPFLLLWGLRARRWRFVASFTALAAALLALSFALQPGWLAGFAAQLTLYPAYIEVSTPAWVLAQYLPGQSQAAELALNAAGLVLLLWTWHAVLARGRAERFWWTVMVTLTITHLIGLRTATPHLVVLTIPLVFYLRALAQQGRGWRAAALLLALLLVPWLHFLLTLGSGKFEHPTLLLPLPLLALAALWLTRRQWWAAPVPAPPDGGFAG